jgi:hypothetical protein
MSISAIGGSSSSFGLAEMMKVRRNGADQDENAASVAKNDGQENSSGNAASTTGMVMGGATAPAKAAAGSSGGGSSDGEYDQYDLNEDGTVSLGELLQAMNQGDTGAQAMVRDIDGESSTLMQRLASGAYMARGDE